MVEYEDWGVNREAGGRPGDGGRWAIAGTAAYGGRSRQIRMVSPGGWHRGVWDAQLYLKLLRGAWL